jgi:hypothetical protein
MTGILRSVLTLVLLLALPQVKAAPWEHWACEGGADNPITSQSYAPGSGEVCCKWTGDSDGTFTTDARRHTGTECAWCMSRGAARPHRHRLLPRVYRGVAFWWQGHQLDQPRRLRRVWGHVS